MLHLNTLRIPVVMIVLGFFAVGCVANRADGLHEQKQVKAKKHLPATPIIEAKKPLDLVQQEKDSLGDEDDSRSIYKGKALFHGKAVCFECHGQNGDIRNVSNATLAKLDPSPTDLRRPTDKSVRQLYLIIKYGLSATGMSPSPEAAKLSDDEVVYVISYLLAIQGHPLPIDVISNQSFRPHTDTDVAISLLCEQEATADFDQEDNCEDRYAKRYRDLIVGRPPDISAARYTEIETGCKERAVKDLDTLALCYRAEYTASRPATRKVNKDQ